MIGLNIRVTKKNQLNHPNPAICDYFYNRFFEIIATSRVIAPLQDGEESPDSAEQCTGEEPGVLVKAGATDSATENYCLLPLPWRGLG